MFESFWRTVDAAMAQLQADARARPAMDEIDAEIDRLERARYAPEPAEDTDQGASR